MATTQTVAVLRHIRRLVAAPKDESDRELVSRFLARRDEAAFTALVRRHGPLVFGVCRRILGNMHDAEDAFQAAFLVLARKASAIHRHESVAGWLHQVAFHLAMRARSQGTTRLRHERAASSRSTPDPLTEVSARELLSALDEELQALPDGYRLPLILCYLESQTRDEAARQLHCSLSTLKRRLEEGKARLHARLLRRGLVLSAALLTTALAQSAATAAVPAFLIASAVKAGLTAGHGGIAASVESLAQTALQVPGAARIKLVSAVVLAASLTLLGAGALTNRSPASHQKAGEAKEATLVGTANVALVMTRADKQPPQAPADADAGKRVTLSGRVVDAQDKPVSGAQVAVFAQTVRPYKDKDLHTTDPDSSLGHAPLLGTLKTGAEGRFGLTFPRSKVPRWMKPPEVAVVGLAPGHAVGWEGVEIKGESVETALRLGIEEPIRGRLVDLQGAPAEGVQVHLLKAAHEKANKFTGLMFYQQLTNARYWPAPVRTDADGRFVLRGINRSMVLQARIQDDRFATDELAVEPGAMGEATLALTPARNFEGRVIAEDTRQPMAGVGVQVVGRRNREQHFASLFARTDKDGRFRINHFAADSYYARTDDVPGRPYFAINYVDTPWADKLKTKQNLELALPRGVLQNGKVVDAATGKPLADAQLMYLPQLFNNPQLKVKPGVDLWVYQVGRARTTADGTFQIPVLPGPGHVAVHAQWGTNYVTHIRTRKEIFGHEREGGYWPANDFIKLDIKPDAEMAAVTVKLQPAVSIQGQLLGPDGKPVAKARLAVRTLTPNPHRETGVTEEREERGLRHGPTIHVKEGQFEVRGCDPSMSYRAYVLDEDNHRAATYALSGKDPVPKPLIVQWQPCATAKARFVDDAGKPAGQYPILVYIKESLKSDDANGAVMRRPAPFTDVIVTEKEGTATLKHLIPGVAYLLLQPDAKEVKEFTAESGKEIDLGAIIVDPKK